MTYETVLKKVTTRLDYLNELSWSGVICNQSALNNEIYLLKNLIIAEIIEIEQKERGN